MKKTLPFMMLFGFLALQGVAYAETVQGTVTNVDLDGNKVTLMRSDTQEEITVSVKDAASLGQVQAGSTVTLEADRGFLGGWHAETVTVGAASTATAEPTFDTTADTTATDDSMSASTDTTVDSAAPTNADALTDGTTAAGVDAPSSTSMATDTTADTTDNDAAVTTTTV